MAGTDLFLSVMASRQICRLSTLPLITTNPFHGMETAKAIATRVTKTQVDTGTTGECGSADHVCRIHWDVMGGTA